MTSPENPLHHAADALQAQIGTADERRQRSLRLALDSVIVAESKFFAPERDTRE